MKRPLLWFVLMAAVVLGGAAEACANEAARWPVLWELAPRGWRGPGFYLSWLKILAAWLVFVMWVGTSDWVNSDMQAHRKLNYLRWNPIIVGTFFLAFVLLWLIPYFWVGFPLLLVAYIAPLTTYIVLRNKAVEPHRRVLTRDHIRYWLSVKLKPLGIKIAAEKPDPHTTGIPVKLAARGGANQGEDAVRLTKAREHKGFRPARDVVHGGLSVRATSILMDFGQQAVGMAYRIDGVWVQRMPEKREKCDPALEALKTLCGLNPADRTNRQQGTFAAEYEGKTLPATFVSQGTASGERVVIQFEEQVTKLEKVDQLGMRQKLLEQVQQLLDAKQGFVLLSAPPESGLRSTTHVLLRSSDRLMRDFAAVEELSNRYEDIENVPVTTYSAAAKESPVTVLPKLLRAEPNVIVVRDLVDDATVGLLSQEVDEHRLVISTIRAKDCAEALLRVLALGPKAAGFAKAITAVLNQRLLRLLCEHCKQPYTPLPEVYQQLGIPQAKVPVFYKPPEPNPEEKKVCEHCRGIGYRGRTGLFELLVVGENVRQALASGPKLEVLRAAARKDGMRSLQEEGVLLVAKGLTSLPELMRVLK